MSVTLLTQRLPNVSAQTVTNRGLKKLLIAAGPNLVKCYLFIFFTGATTHCGFVFYNPLAGLQPLRVRGFLIKHTDAPQSVGILWTSDESVAETST